MIRKIIYGIYAIIGMMVVTACSSRPDVYEISLEKMQGFPTEDAGFLKGVSALYAGVIDGNLLIAGGCNFPDTPAADGGKKVFYPDVYITSLSMIRLLSGKNRPTASGSSLWSHYFY